MPSARTASSGACVDTFGPAYTIRLPSGDHTGFGFDPATRGQTHRSASVDWNLEQSRAARLVAADHDPPSVRRP